jgi:hypothetical protein
MDTRRELTRRPSSQCREVQSDSVERERAEAVERSRAVAAEVGAAYVTAASKPHDAVVVRAYQRLQAETDRLFHDVVRSDVPNPLRIVFTRCREPYGCDRELIEAFRACRILEITTAATSAERIHPLMGCEYGGAFDRFRAVHDLIGHAGTGFGFDLVDEVAAWRTQDRLHGGLARWALATELLAINSAWPILGEAPPHKAMLLGPALLRRSRARTGFDDADGRSCTSWRSIRSKLFS